MIFQIYIFQIKDMLFETTAVLKIYKAFAFICKCSSVVWEISVPLFSSCYHLCVCVCSYLFVITEYEEKAKISRHLHAYVHSCLSSFTVLLSGDPFKMNSVHIKL